ILYCASSVHRVQRMLGCLPSSTCLRRIVWNLVRRFRSSQQYLLVGTLPWRAENKYESTRSEDLLAGRMCAAELQSISRAEKPRYTSHPGQILVCPCATRSNVQFAIFDIANTLIRIKCRT